LQLSIHHTIRIKAPARDVLSAVTTPSSLDSWWTSRSSGEPGVGERYNFYFDDNYDWYAEVIEYVVEEHITYRMIECSAEWVGTQLKFSVIPEGASIATLILDHTHWAAESRELSTTRNSWLKYLGNLRSFLENGISTPYESKCD